MDTDDTAAKNMDVFSRRDRSWNARTSEFMDAHTDDVVVHQPGSHTPRRGTAEHQADMDAFFAAFSDITIGPVGPDSRPQYKAQFGSGDLMCGISVMSGTHDGELNLYGKIVPPTGKRVDIELCTVARFENGKIAEERLYYDMLLLAMDIGVWP